MDAISQSSASAHHFCIGCGTGAISGHLPSLYLERDTDRLGSVSVSFTWHVGHVSHTRNTDKQITLSSVYNLYSESWSQVRAQLRMKFNTFWAKVTYVGEVITGEDAPGPSAAPVQK